MIGTAGFRITGALEFQYQGYLGDWETGGFIACDWLYNTYELFWKQSNDVRIPDNVVAFTDIYLRE